MKKLLMLVIAGSALAACSSNKAPTVAKPTPAPVEAPAPVVVASAPVVATTPAVSNHNSAYFAFNKYDIKDEYTGIVKANSSYLAANAKANVQVQGNTDDIGSVEYNLALGQKRADAVKKALIATGAHKDQVEATSNGKLKAKYANTTSESRAMNRRVDIMYKAEQPSGYSTDNNGLPLVDGSVYSATVAQGVQ